MDNIGGQQNINNSQQVTSIINTFMGTIIVTIILVLIFIAFWILLHPKIPKN